MKNVLGSEVRGESKVVDKAGLFNSQSSKAFATTMFRGGGPILVCPMPNARPVCLGGTGTQCILVSTGAS